MVESEGWKNATHLARMGVFYGSVIEVTLSSMALVFISLFFDDIEKAIDLGNHARVVMYSTLSTTSAMLASGILGLVTTWSREKVRNSAPAVKQEAYWKATIEGSLLCYMIPYNILVAIWICTTPGPSAWVKALKVVMSFPSMFFQFGWFMACRKFWQVVESGHGEDLVMPDEPVHTFADLSEPLLPEDSSEVDLSARRVFKSASQFGPMGIPGLGMTNGEAPATDESMPAEASGSAVDVENPESGVDVPDAEGRASEEATYSRYINAALNYVGVATSAGSSSSPRDPNGDVAAAHPYPPSNVSPVLSPSRLHRGATDGADSISLTSSTDISDDKENSARGPGSAAVAIAGSADAAGEPAAAAAPAAPPAAEEAVLSPSVRSQGLSLTRTPPKVPPLVIPFPPPTSPHHAHYASGSGYMSTPTPSTAQPGGTPPAATPPRQPPTATPPRTTRGGAPPTTPSTSTRMSALLSSRKLISPMRSGRGGPAVEAGLPPPSPQSDLSLSRFMHLIKNRKHATKAAQKLPQQFTGVSAQFAAKQQRAQHGAAADGAGAAVSTGSVPTPKAGGGADTPGAPRIPGRAALSAEAAVLEREFDEVSGSREEEAAAAPAGSGTAPRWDRESMALAAVTFDDSASSEDDFQDAWSESRTPPSTSSGGARIDPPALHRRSGSGAAESAKLAISSKVSTVWNKVKARTASTGRGGGE